MKGHLSCEDTFSPRIEVSLEDRFHSTLDIITDFSSVFCQHFEGQIMRSCVIQDQQSVVTIV